MPEKINLSIIVPHYNDSRRLKRLINSVPVKEDIEILVIDDNSPKDEWEKTIEYMNNQFGKKISYYVNPNESHSAGACRNIGLQNARGKWLLFADADDYFTDIMYDTVKSHFDDEADIIFFPPTSQKEDGSYSDRHEAYAERILSYLEEPSRKNELIMRIIETPWSKMIRHELVETNDIIFDEVRYSNDVMFSAKTGVFAENVSCENKTIYVINEDEKSLTKVKNKNSFDIRKRVLIDRYIFLYHHLTKAEMKMLGMKFAGIRYVMSPIRNGYGIDLGVQYLKLLLQQKMPLFLL